MANIRWATLNAYSLPVMEKLEVEQAQHQQKIRDNAALRLEKEGVEREKEQERLAKGHALGIVRLRDEALLTAVNTAQRKDRAIAAAVNQTLEVAGNLEELQERFERFKVASSAATLDAYIKIDEVEVENAHIHNEIEGMEEMLPMIQRNTRQLEQENQNMREELVRRRAQSPQRREQLAAKDTEIERLRKDLAAAREAFSSCTLTNPK